MPGSSTTTTMAKVMMVGGAVVVMEVCIASLLHFIRQFIPNDIHNIEIQYYALKHPASVFTQYAHVCKYCKLSIHPRENQKNSCHFLLNKWLSLFHIVLTVIIYMKYILQMQIKVNDNTFVMILGRIKHNVNKILFVLILKHEQNDRAQFMRNFLMCYWKATVLSHAQPLTILYDIPHFCTPDNLNV